MKKFIKYLPHFLRKRFNEKYILIESDDWGMERAPSNNSIEWMKKKFGEDKLTRWSTDSLETTEDLNLLYELLESYKSKFEFPPVITSNFITYNIDYSDTENLIFTPMSKRLNHNSCDLKDLYKKGIEEKYIFPQLHGFSHYNINELEKYFGTKEGREAAGEKFLAAKSTIRGNLSFLQGELSEIHTLANKLKDAADEFNNFFGFYSRTIIPPTYIFDSSLINTLKNNSVGLIQSSNRLQTTKKSDYRIPFFQKRKGLYWSVRNARLDPHPDYKFYSDQCIDTIGKIFENKSPAVIDFHRVNFAGKFAPGYRERTLKELKDLFDGIHKRWPDAKFIHTQKLNDILWQQETR